MSESADQPCPPRRVRNPWGHGDRLRQEILCATERLLGEQDTDDALTIRGVARAAGIAPASIYPHFGDLTELVGALMADQLRRMAELMAQAREAAPPADPLGRLGAVMRAYLEFATGNPAHQRALLAFPKGVGGAWEGNTSSGPGAEIGQLVAEALRACVAAGHPLRVEVELAAQLILVGAFGRVVLVQASRGLDRGLGAQEFVGELMALVFQDPPEPAAFGT